MGPPWLHNEWWVGCGCMRHVVCWRCCRQQLLRPSPPCSCAFAWSRGRPPTALLLAPPRACFAEIADAAFDPENYRQIMGVLARRLQERVRLRRTERRVLAGC